MNEIPSEGAAASNLCTKCGLCCNGVLFDWVPVAADEEARLRGVGLVLEPNEQGARFTQPCPKFKDGLCGIYADRPGTCRRFRCELLRKVEGGDVGLGQAQAIVAEAKAMIEEIQPTLEREVNLVSIGNLWSRLLTRWESDSPIQRAEGTSSALLLKLTVLNHFLDRHFRREGQRRIMDG